MKNINTSFIRSQDFPYSPKLQSSITGLIVLQIWVLVVSKLTPFPRLLPLESVNSSIERAVGEVVVNRGLQYVDILDNDDKVEILENDDKHFPTLPHSPHTYLHSEFHMESSKK